MMNLKGPGSCLIPRNKTLISSEDQAGRSLSRNIHLRGSTEIKSL